MLEALLPALAGCYLLAAASFRFRRDGGIDPAAVPWLRGAAVALLLLAFALAGSALPGERIVRFLGAVSLACVVVVLALSTAPLPLLRPIRRIAGAKRR